MMARPIGALLTLSPAKRFLEPPEPRAGTFDTEIIVVDEEEFVRRQDDHPLHVAIQFRRIVCREHQRRLEYQGAGTSHRTSATITPAAVAV